MQILFSVATLVLIILFFTSSPKNKINQWCTVAGFFFWLGVAKQAVLFEIIPILEDRFGMIGLDVRFAPIHSVCTWAVYTFAMPAVTIAGFHFDNFITANSKRMRLLKCAVFLPMLMTLLFFSPLHFREYQLHSRPFWLTFTIYNFSFALIVTIVVLKGLNAKGSVKIKNHKKRVVLVLLPPMYYWLISIFIIHLFQWTDYFELWQMNVFIIMTCIFIHVFLAFQDGFMGLKFVRQKYDWDTNMSLVSLSAAYTSHFLKSHTPKMEMCINNLTDHIASLSEDREIPKEISILTSSVTSLTNYFNRINHHSQIIEIKEEVCSINDLFSDSILGLQHKNLRIKMLIKDSNSKSIQCDKSHMVEVFFNIITNASEATRENGIVEISDKADRKWYNLVIKDNGTGIDEDALDNIFKPYFSTKNKEKNFGLGLLYCKNVIEQHSGRIYAESQLGQGTTITIALPRKRVTIKNTPTQAVSSLIQQTSMKSGGQDE